MSNYPCPHCSSHKIKIVDFGIYNDHSESMARGSGGNKRGNFFINILCYDCSSFGPLEFRTKLESYKDFCDFVANGSNIEGVATVKNPY